MSQKTLLSFFWDLASTNEKIRIDAAISLIKHLKLKENEQSKQEVTQSEDLNYTIKRLIKGLGSSRKAARQGFAMALTEITLLFENVTIEDIMKYMKESLVVTKSCSSQEERDAYFGQIFGYATIGRVICLSKQYKNVKIPISSITVVIEGLKRISAKKSYLQEICYKAIVDILALLNFDEFQEHVLQLLENDIKCNWEKCSPDLLIIVLATWRLFKDRLGHKTFKKSWKSSHLDNTENYPCFAKILQNSHNSLHKVHYVWEEVFHLVLNSPNSDFALFWSTVIDGNLFQSSHERKFLGFKLLEKVLPMLSVEQVKIVFSQQLMHCLFNSLSHNTNYLYASTKQMVEGFSKNLVQKEKQNLIVPVIRQLLGRNGNVCFDATTKTKAVENLLPKIPVEDLPTLVSWMNEVFIAGTTNDEENNDSRTIEKTREGVLGLFLSLMRCKQLAHTSSWVLEAVYFIFENAYFIKKDRTVKVSPPVSQRTRVVCQERFNSILGELAIISDKTKSSTDGASKSASKAGQHRTYGLADDGCLWISHIMQHAKVLLKSEDFEIVGESWTEEIQKLFSKTVKIVKKLEQKTGELKLENRAFMLMFLYIGVQLFSEPQQAQEILEELFQCYDKVKTQMSERVEDEEPPWMDVITEILVSFLTDSSNLRRQVVNQVFNIIVPHLTSSALNIILEAIDPRNGLNEDSVLQVESLSDNEDDDEEMVSDDDDKPEEEENEVNHDDSDDMSDENEEDEDVDSVDPLFKVDLQAALGNALANEEDDDVESPDDDLDDEAMMKLDDALSEVFKQHLKAKDQKKKAKDAKKSVLHFKLRVLDLVEILIKKQPCNDLILELIQPLVNIIRACLNSKDYVTLGERAQGIFKNKLCTIKERHQMSPSYIENVHKNIESLLKEAMKGPSVAIVTMMSTCCLFLIRQLRGSASKQKGENETKDQDASTDEPEDEFKQLDFARLKIAYCQALKDFMLNRNTHLHPLLFQDLINRYPVIGWQLAEDLVGYITQGINNYRKIQACTLLFQLLTKQVHPHMHYIKSLVPLLQNAFHITFRQLSTPDVEMKAKHLRQILKLATRFIKIMKTDPNIWSLLDTKDLGESLDIASQSTTVERAHDLKNLISCLNSEIEGGPCVNGDVNKPKKKRKRKKSEKIENEDEQKETKKTKKQRKAERKKKKKSE